jgi:protein required for attachment to host cells
VGQARSAASTTDWHQATEDAFASRLAADLYVHAHEGDFSQLVLIAPPKALGLIREALHPEVKQRLIAESAKTFTQHPVSEIEKFITTL